MSRITLKGVRRQEHLVNLRRLGPPPPQPSQPRPSLALPSQLKRLRSLVPPLQHLPPLDSAPLAQTRIPLPRNLQPLDCLEVEQRMRSERLLRNLPQHLHSVASALSSSNSHSNPRVSLGVEQVPSAALHLNQHLVDSARHLRRRQGRPTPLAEGLSVLRTRSNRRLRLRACLVPPNLQLLPMLLGRQGRPSVSPFFESDNSSDIH